MGFKLLPHEVVTHSDVRTQTSPAEIPTGVLEIQAKAMWDQGYRGKGIVIAVIDTGVLTSHPDLTGQVIEGRNFTRDYAADPTNFQDNNFHGTHVAGIIAAKDNGTGVVGVAPESKILALKAMDSKGSGAFQEVHAAIRYATDWRGPAGEKVRIITMSLAGRFTTPAIKEAIKLADEAGICIVCAAGNNGDGNSNTEEINYPAHYPECIAVSAYNGRGSISDYSASNDNVDVAAPGDDINSTNHLGGYSTATGTSMSAPHVAGALALIANKIDKALGREATGKEMYEYLINLNTSLLPGVPKTLQGFGSVQLKDAANPYGSDIPPVIPTPTVPTVGIGEVNMEDVLHWLTTSTVPAMLGSADYWRDNLVAGKTVRGEYAAVLLKKIYITQALNANIKQ